MAANSKALDVRASAVFGMLRDETKLRVLLRLEGGEAHVTAISDAVG
jgi:hypothetical protein